MEIFLVYIIGAGLYAGIELLWRGWTHWSMLLCGGLCFSILYIISSTALPLWIKCLAGTASISIVEFVTGCLVNIILGWHIWDYSNCAFNVLGQICPLYSFFWLLLCLPGFALCDTIRRLIS